MTSPRRGASEARLAVLLIMGGLLAGGTGGCALIDRGPWGLDPATPAAVFAHPTHSPEGPATMGLPPATVAPTFRSAILGRPADTTGPVQISASQTRSEEGRPINFHSAVARTDPLVYVWNFGDNITSDQADPSHVYEILGNMSVVLHVFDANGSVGSASLSISIAGAIAIAGPVVPPEGATGAPIPFQSFVYYGVTPYTYFWQFGDRNSSHEVAPSHAYGRPGTYLATLWVNDSVGAQAQLTELVLVPYPNGTGNSPPPSASTEWIHVGIGAGVVLVVAAISVLWVRARGRR